MGVTSLHVEEQGVANVWAEAAVKATPEDHPEKAGRWQSRLGTMFLSQYKRTRNRLDLEATINHAQAAVAATAEEHPDKAERSSSLAVMLFLRFQRHT